MQSIRTTNQGTSKNKMVDGLTLLEESILKPDTRLRSCAKAQGCYDHLMDARALVLQYIQDLREEVLKT
jgi:hypothetical protein